MVRGVFVMPLLPLILLPLLLASPAPAGASVYSYSLNITLVNGNGALLPGEPSSPYYHLLNQNIFVNNSLQTAVLESVRLNGEPARWEPSSDGDGNPMIAVLSDTPLLPRENATLELLFTLEIRRAAPLLGPDSVGTISEVPAELVEQYPLVGSWDITQIANSPEIIETARGIKGGEENVLAVISRLLRWFEDNMTYAEGSSPRTIAETFSSREGDCDDQAGLFVLFCRVLGIPAYVSVGPIYLPGEVRETDENLSFNLQNVGWHGWAMVYLPAKGGGAGEWVPVDLTFFKGFSYDRGHLRSTNVEQHITGSALAAWDTACYLDARTADYIGSSISSREDIIGSDVLWIEDHSMILTSAQPIQVPGGYLTAALLALILTITALAAFSLRTVRSRSGRRDPSGASPPDIPAAPPPAA